MNDYKIKLYVVNLSAEKFLDYKWELKLEKLNFKKAPRDGLEPPTQ